MPPKSLACRGFLYKVVHKISRLRKYNRSREIEFNFLTAWTISLKFGTLVQHAPGYKTLHQIFLIFARGHRYGLSKSKKGGKIITNIERSQLSPQAKIKNFEATFCRFALLLSFCKNRFRLLRFIKKLNSTELGAFFRHFCVSKVITTAHAHKCGVFNSVLCQPTTTLAKKIETATQAKLHTRACSREHAPVPLGARLSQFFWPGSLGSMWLWSNKLNSRARLHKLQHVL